MSKTARCFIRPGLVSTIDLAGRAYLEMSCRLPGKEEAYSRGIDQAVSGTNDWVSCQIPFVLKEGETPDLIRLNVVIEGEGNVEAKDIELCAIELPLTATADRAPASPKPVPPASANGWRERLEGA